MSYKLGGHDEGKGSLDRHKKIDDSVGMCGSETDYDSCWSRICSPDKNTALRDVLRGLLVLIALAIVVTIVFLLCFFLLNDIEHKEEELVDTLIKDFSTGNRVEAEPEFSFRDENTLSKYPYDIDPNSGQEKKTGPAKGGTEPRDKSLQNIVSEAPSDYHPEDDLYLSFGNLDSSKAVVGDSEIANTEGSFVNAFVPAAEEENEAYDIETDVIEAESSKECVPLRLPLCTGSMPWTVTTFPNFVNNNNLDELRESLMYFQSIIVGSRCSTRGAEYTCAVLEPACGPDGIPLPPCRAFCEDLVKTCSEFLIAGNEHNEALNCQRFPDSRNPNVCVDISTASSNAPSSSTEGKISSTPKSDDAKPAEENRHINPQEIDSFSEIEEPSRNSTHDSTLSEPEKLPEEELKKLLPEEIDVKKSVPEETEAPVFICDHTKFLCDDGSDCLGEDSVCDGVQHCLDNSDELNCTQPECGVDDFACATTKYCIPKTWVCDGADDCRDNSDEVNCPDKPKDDTDDDTLLAQASNPSPGLANVDGIPDSEGSESIIHHTKDKTKSPSSSSDNQFAFDANVPEEIMASFPKFGDNTETEAGAENVEKKTDDDLEPKNEKQSEQNILNKETGESQDSVTGAENDRAIIRRRRPIRPDLVRFNKQREKQNPRTNLNDRTENVLTPGNDDSSDSEPSPPDDSEKKHLISNTRLAVPMHVPGKRLNPGADRILSRRPFNNRLRERVQIQKNDQEPVKTEVETQKADSTDQKEENLVSAEEEISEPQEEVQNQEVQNQVLQTSRRRDKRPISTSESDSHKPRIETPPSVRKAHPRRPVSIVRRRPTAETFNNADSSDAVELLREGAGSESKQEADAPVVAQPITLPERVIPTNRNVQSDSSDKVLNNDANDNDANDNDANDDNENNYNYDFSPENSDKSEKYEYDEQYENNEPENEPSGQNESPVQENKLKNYNAFPQRYNTQDNIYKTPPNQYGGHNIAPINPHVQRQPQQNQQPAVNPQAYFHHGQFGANQVGAASQVAQNYYARRPQAPEYYEAPSYSQQTQQHQPSYPENVYHYANPSFPFRSTDQEYRDDYRH